MIDETLLVLSRTPRPSKQAIQIRPEHRTRMIERKKGIKFELLQFSLTRNGSSPSLHSDMGRARMVLL